MWRYIRSSALIFLIATFLSYCSATGPVNKNDCAFTSATSTSTKLKILGVFGHPGKSHFVMFAPILKELARRGHQITVLSHFPRSDKDKAKEPLPNYRDISLKDPKIGIYMNVIDMQRIQHTFYRIFMEYIMLQQMASKACESVLLQNAVIRDFINSNETFDVMLTENFNTNCFLAFAHHFKVPYLSLSSHYIMPWTNQYMGNVDNPSYIMAIFNGYDQPMDFFSRLSNTFVMWCSKVVYRYWQVPNDQYIANKAFGPDLPSLNLLARQIQALLVNFHYSLSGNRPQLSNIVEIGGIHIPSKINPLPKDIAEFLDNAHEGVLYFSLGSMIKISTMPAHKMNVILNVISSMPYKVLWKWEDDQLPRIMDNVMARKWLPQFDVLNHPNVKCYFGHGGLLGLSEAVHVGVPMLLMPMFGDQFHNAYTAKARGIAEIIHYNELNESPLRQALNKLFNDTRYRENAETLSRAYRDRPSSALDTAVWWTEYVARGNGKPYVRNEGTDLPWFQFYLIDVAFVLIIVHGLLVYIVFRLIMLLLNLQAGGSKGHAKKEAAKGKKKND